MAHCKRLWNQSEAKYPTFWNASPVVHTLGNQPLDWENAAALRLRLILCRRLSPLYRSIDLARLDRTISFLSGVPFILVQRKGWPHKKWEEVLVMPDRPALSP